MEFRNKDDLGKAKKFIDATTQDSEDSGDSDMEYQSLLTKRKSFDKDYDQKERKIKFKVWKIVLLISLTLLIVIGNILFNFGVFDLKHSQYLENRRDTNMFEIVSVNSTINQAKIQLKIKDDLSKLCL